MIMGAKETPSFAALILVLVASTARADAVVTACAVDSQAGGLAQALAAGGVIRFACSPGSTIRMTRNYTLTGSTLIDGGDAITLDGQGAFGPLLSAAPNTNTVLRRIAVRSFAVRPSRPPAPGAIALGTILGSVLRTSGDAELDHVTIELSDSPIVVRGNATVRDSTFVGNQGYALSVDGAAHVERSQFTGNVAALLMSAGWVRSSNFFRQTAGAINVAPMAGPVEIRHSVFDGTRGGASLALSQRAGRGGPQIVSVRANTFSNNDGGEGGGAIDLFDVVQEARDRNSPAADGLMSLPPAAFVFSYNRFEGNHGGRGGAIAANLAHTRGLISTGDLFIANVANGDGGGIAAAGGDLRLSHALFKGNRAGGRGAALALAADGQATVANSLVIGNTGPRGAMTGASLTLANVTIADNDAAGLLLEGARGQVSNAIFARNRPADCAGVATAALRGGNLQSDGSCPGITIGDAYLDDFYVPIAGSPALRAGDLTVCAADPVAGFDLSFQGRLGPTACALGAFEHAPMRKFSGPTDRHEQHATAQDDFQDDDGYRPFEVPGSPP